MSRNNYAWVGDSITEGYGDNITISCNGIPGRLLGTVFNTTAPVLEQHLNLGASGMLVTEYIDIAKGVIGADPTFYTAVFCSVWSPNLLTGQEVPAVWPTEPEVLNTMLQALYSFEEWLLERSIIFMPVFLAGSPFNANAFTRQRLQAHVDFCANRWPHFLNINTPIQDPAITDGPYIGSAFRTDVTHPSSAGYSAQADYVRPLIPGAIATAIAFYGFVE